MDHENSSSGLKVRTRSKLIYPDNFVEVLDASFANSSWIQLQEHLKTAPFTLAHGDFRASNMIMQLSSSSNHNADDLLEGLKIFDWSEVGPWESATDLAQTVISDFPKELFDKVEGILKAYHVRLLELGVKDYSRW
jgi:aminoglycoside phosphotransferase (APT) family kinase protein